MKLMKKNEGYAIDKSDAFNILDRTIDFVRNCDSKASMFLGVFGVILTIAFTTDAVGDIKSILSSAYTNITFCSIIYLLFFVASVACTFYGLFKIIKVLGVQVGREDYDRIEGLDLDSKIFFDHISKNNSYLVYKGKLLRMSDEDFINDILSQIYINSIICSDKYKSYKYGLKYSLLGFFAFFFLWAIGAILY